ncbi:MAG: NAD-binding protein [Oscillospiraceae bacterium]|nr:NAD-binding protein [Oscillospiraceae bacterium]
MKVIIIGGGKVGYYLAKTLLEHHHEPRIIEINKQKCEKIANELDIPVFSGDGTMATVLSLAGIEEANVFVSVTGQDQNNLIACQLAKNKFNISKTIARINNPKNSYIFKQLGVDISISTTANIANMIEREVDVSEIKHLASLNRGQASIIEFEVPKKFKYSGKTLLDLPTPQDSIIVTVSRNGELIIPRGNTEIFIGDMLVMIVKDTAIHEVGDLFGL